MNQIAAPSLAQCSAMASMELAAIPELERQVLEVERQATALAAQRRVIDDNRARLSTQQQQIASALETLRAQQAALQARLTDLDDRQRQLEARAQGLAQMRCTLELQANAVFRAQAATGQSTIQLTPVIEVVEPAGSERRRAPRIPVAVDVTFASEHTFYTGVTENLSEGGLFIATYDILPRGTELDVTINLPGGAPFTARGVVRWAREHTPFTADVVPGIGLELIELAPEQRAQIANFLRLRAPLLHDCPGDA